MLFLLIVFKPKNLPLSSEVNLYVFLTCVRTPPCRSTRSSASGPRGTWRPPIGRQNEVNLTCLLAHQKRQILSIFHVRLGYMEATHLSSFSLSAKWLATRFGSSVFFSAGRHVKLNTFSTSLGETVASQQLQLHAGRGTAGVAKK